MNKEVKDICKLLSDKLALNIKIVDIAEMSSVADYYIVCSGKSTSQVKSLFEYLEQKMEDDGYQVLRYEGVAEGRWIALDYGNIVVHIFHQETREIYMLDTLWDNGNNVTVYED